MVVPIAFGKLASHWVHNNIKKEKVLCYCILKSIESILSRLQSAKKMGRELKLLPTA